MDTSGEGAGNVTFRIAEAHRQSEFEGEWWRRGFPHSSVPPGDATLSERVEQARRDFHVRVYRRSLGLKV